MARKKKEETTEVTTTIKPLEEVKKPENIREDVQCKIKVQSNKTAIFRMLPNDDVSSKNARGTMVLGIEYEVIATLKFVSKTFYKLSNGYYVKDENNLTII